MAALNSYSTIPGFTDTYRALTTLETFSRTFESQGLFIIPYDNNRLLAALEVRFAVLFTENESRSLWTNPELSFYGYCHVRRNKETLGSPVQLNLRNQFVFTWSDNTAITQIENLGTLVNLARFLGSTIQFGTLRLPAPIVTDLSFGFQKAGRYQVEVALYYWDETLWTLPGLPVPAQTLPNPNAIENLAPPDSFNPNNSTAPLSPPYDDGTGDFGESDPSAPSPPPPSTLVVAEVRVTSTLTLSNGTTEQFDRNGFTGVVLTPVTFSGFVFDSAAVFAVLSTGSGQVQVFLGASGNFLDGNVRDSFVNSAQVEVLVNPSN